MSLLASRHLRPAGEVLAAWRGVAMLILLFRPSRCDARSRREDPIAQPRPGANAKTVERALGRRNCAPNSRPTVVRTDTEALRMTDFRIETDSLGEVRVPADRLWGAQTQRSLEYFSIGKDLMPREMIAAYAILKKAAAFANHVGGRLGRRALPADRQGLRRNPRRPARRHVPAACLDDRQRHAVQHERQRGDRQPLLPARRRAARSKRPVHPNDHVNMAQSTNDTFPSAMNIAAAVGATDAARPGGRSASARRSPPRRRNGRTSSRSGARICRTRRR